MTDGHVRHDGLVATAPVGRRAFAAHGRLGGRSLNFVPVSHEEASADPDWHADEREVRLGTEAPGPPAVDGPYAAAREVMTRYEFADPATIRAVFDPASDLEGRDLLLVGRFVVLRFHMGVRIGGVEEGSMQVGDRTVHRFRWHYRTLEGHLERGHMAYEVTKDEVTGNVDFRIRAYSQRARIGNPIVRLGFMLFGRWTQLRFYQRTLDRMQQMVAERVDGSPPA